MKKLICLLVLVMVVSGCVTTKRINLLNLGMTKAEVIKAMGTPASTKAEYGREVLEYILYPTWDSTWADRQQFWVILEDGKVVKYGRAGDFGTAEKADITVEIENKKRDSELKLK
ncbi:MAG: outer membrane protein assembly factor BamE [Deltaproteobacteria bacterium]|nr:outer membrane protein assembly factor BamE [Deltaproteobacteria bacterium]